MNDFKILEDIAYCETVEDSEALLPWNIELDQAGVVNEVAQSGCFFNQLVGGFLDISCACRSACQAMRRPRNYNGMSRHRFLVGH